MRDAILMIVLAGCGNSARRDTSQPENSTAHEEAATTGTISPTGDRHPGTIAFEDHVQHKTWTERAADVPQTFAWREVGGRWRPVVKIVIDGMANRREMTMLGPNGEFLEHTTGYFEK